MVVHALARAVTLGAVLLALVSAAPAGAQTAVRVLLDGRIDVLGAPFLLAQERGYFRAENLDVSLEPGTGSRDAVARLAAGDHHLGVGDINTLIRMRDENPAVDLKAVFMLQDAPPFAVIGRKSRGLSEDPSSLAGKVIGASSADGAAAQWPVYRALAKLEAGAARIESVGLAVREPMLASGELDAVFGSAVSTPVVLRSRGVPADDLVVLTMRDAGLQLYGDAVLATGAFARENPDALRAFLRALSRGMRDAVADPAAAVDAALRRNEQLRREVENERLLRAVQTVHVTPWVRENGWGGVDPARFARAIEQIGLAFGFRQKPQVADVFTGEFLPDPEDRRID